MQSRNSKLILWPFFFLDKIDSPFCLQNCFFLLAAHFAQIFAKQILSKPSDNLGLKECLQNAVAIRAQGSLELDGVYGGNCCRKDILRKVTN